MTTPTPPPQNPAVRATIAALWVYPIKSCAGVRMAQAELTDTGLLYDRAWMLVDDQSCFVSQRELPRMALVQPRWRLGELELRAPGMLPLHLALNAAEGPCSVQVWGDTVQARDMGDLAAQWFSDFLAPDAPVHLKRLRLVRFDPEQRRACPAKWTGGHAAHTQFGDGFPLLVTSTASVAELNQRLGAAGHTAVDQRRFRPNIVLGGLQANDEDRLGPLHIDADGGQAVLSGVKPCTRCPIPNIDPTTATANSAVGDTLQAYRQNPRMGGAVTFGMNAIVLEGDGVVLREGQVVTADWRFD